MLLQRLHKKTLLQATREGAKYVYAPSDAKGAVGRDALKRLLTTFFNDSPAEALNALISEEAIDERELVELEALVAKAKRENS